MAKGIKNVGESVRARLLTIAREKNQTLDLVLTKFVLERLLYRLGTSDYRDRFILKGAMLTSTWFADPHRPTRDVDFLGRGDSEPDATLDIFRSICSIPFDDGVEFDLKSLRIVRIRDELEYGGHRIRMVSIVAKARVHVVIDIGFGDAVEPGIEDIRLPALLDFPEPDVRAYPKESVIAEKLHAMVILGMSNSRLKDYYDIWMLISTFDFDNDRLSRAIRATFERRKTDFPVGTPVGLSDEFSADPRKQDQWRALTIETSINPGSLAQAVNTLREFLLPRIEAAVKQD